MPSDPGTGAANTPDLETFDNELKKLLRGGNDDLSQGRPERRDEVRPSVGLERNQDDSGLDFAPIRD